MSFASLLDHRVTIARRDPTGAADEMGHPIVTTEVVGPFSASIQPKRVREVALIEQGGAAIGEYTIFTLPRRVSEADAIIHDTTTCPKSDASDYPTIRFEVTGVRNAAGRGHHLEIDARLVGSSGGVEDDVEGS